MNDGNLMDKLRLHRLSLGDFWKEFFFASSRVSVEPSKTNCTNPILHVGVL